MLCEAAHSTMRAPGPLRAFGQRVRSRRGSAIATLAVARKLATLARHMLTKQQDYLYERPALTHRKRRRLELTAGAELRSNPGGRARHPRQPAAVEARTSRSARRRIQNTAPATRAWKPHRPTSDVLRSGDHSSSPSLTGSQSRWST